MAFYGDAKCHSDSDCHHRTNENFKKVSRIESIQDHYGVKSYKAAFIFRKFLCQSRLFLRPDHIWRSSFHLSMLPLQFFTNLCPLAADETSLRKAGRAVASPLLAMHREDNDEATSKRTDESYQNSAPNQIEILRDKSSATI